MAGPLHRPRLPRGLVTRVSLAVVSMAAALAVGPPMRADGPDHHKDWPMIGHDIANTRYQRSEAAGIVKADVPKLKLKWAWGFPLGISAYNQPAIASGRVFTGGDTGWVYSLDAKTGCWYWGYKTDVTMRGAVSVGPVTGQGTARFAVYVGDAKANVYAIDAQTGRLLWKRRVEDHWFTIE